MDLWSQCRPEGAIPMQPWVRLRKSLPYVSFGDVVLPKPGVVGSIPSGAPNEMPVTWDNTGHGRSSMSGCVRLQLIGGRAKYVRNYSDGSYWPTPPATQTSPSDLPPPNSRDRGAG
ncbi:hypothetical protein Aple_042500 [Acrocarpospora pleiomorpha]|uniref:Uncharacterized protein n=1 Tax=Acrocarpospora pleiomorpha TaxID=90975 RepID=A0A5M3XJC9_9ACTN|nr:hypothetical protein Aple_042500 [Acrocarpospora pleiomorpha]